MEGFFFIFNLVKEYKDRKLQFTTDGRILDEDGKSIMMDWERPIMIHQAKQISKLGGDILNVGYGMGFIDFEIEKYNPKTHHIIEIHPQIQSKILDGGWYKKSHVNLYFGDWKSFLKRLPKFDGIYFDTWDEQDTQKFIEFSPNILKKNGVLSFFNNPKDDFDGDNIPDFLKSTIEQFFEIEITSLEIPFIDSPYQQTGDENRAYWDPDWKTYYSPNLKLK